MDINEFRYNNYFLSNFSNYGFEYEGVYFKNVEQAYQWAKAETENDKLLILQCSTAKDAKDLGHKIKCDIKKWDENKTSIMEEILVTKFSNYHLKCKLVRTGESKLIEGNYWHDNFWGQCYCNKCSKVEGKNILGNILMKIRSNLMTNK
jgi:ribA/ribD-fused uncharacterized protein